MDASRQIMSLYALASAGDPEAYAWLMAWHGWCHRIDDHIDEPGHDPSEVVDLCADGCVLFSSAWYGRHARALGPLVAIVAEQYRSSLGASGVLGDALRIAGNQVVLAVAYLQGGRPLLRVVSDQLWPLVRATQLETSNGRSGASGGGDDSCGACHARGAVAAAMAGGAR